VRGILGVPGAAVYSGPLVLPAGIERVHLAPSHAYALVEFSDRQISVLPLNGLSVGAVVAINGALPVADLVAFSPSGLSAVLFSGSAGRLQVVTGLPDKPRIAQDLDATALPELPSSVAISDDASSVLLSSLAAVHRLLPDGSARVVVTVQSGASLAFIPKSANAAIADRAAGSVYLFDAQTGGLFPNTISAGPTTVGEVSASSDGEMLFITDADGRRIWSLHLLSGEVRSLELPARPVIVDRLKNADSFLVSSEPGQPGWILYYQSTGMRAVFIPTAARVARRAPE